MKRRGPILTLAAGAGLAAVLMVLNLGASRDATSEPVAGAGTAAPAGPTTSASAAATATAAPKPARTRTFAGYLSGGASLAIAITGEQAIAYVCDGRKAEAWLSGTARNGTLDLAGLSDARLTGSYRDGEVAGRDSAAGKTLRFKLGPVQPPSGLYRASAQVRGAKLVGGWIVLADGTQVGVLTVAGQPQPAPPLDPATTTVVVGGEPVPATAVDGTTSLS